MPNLSKTSTYNPWAKKILDDKIKDLYQSDLDNALKEWKENHPNKTTPEDLKKVEQEMKGRLHTEEFWERYNKIEQLQSLHGKNIRDNI